MKRRSALLRHDPGTDSTAAALASGDRATLPRVEEQVEIGKRVVETARVRIRKRVETRNETLDLTGWRDTVQVEHVPVGRVVDSAPPVRHEGDVTIVPVLEEVVVTVRKLFLKEELHISTRREMRHERRTVRLRRERIEVDRVAVGGDSSRGLREVPSPTPLTAAFHTQESMMSCTVVGVFDEFNDAQAAREKLIDAGVDAQSVQLSSSRGAETADREQHFDWRGFFARIFGLRDNNEQPGHYAEAVRRGSTALTVSLEDDAQIDTVSAVLNQCGAIDVDKRVENWRASGYTGFDPAAPAYGEEEAKHERERFQVLQEDVKVGKREVPGGGVRVHRRVSETPVEENVELRDERAVVERRPVDRPASDSELDRAFSDDSTIEISETSEEPVVSKSARVVEEVDVGKKVSTRTQKVRDTARRADVAVENATAAGGDDRRRETTDDRDTSYAGQERRMGINPSYSGPERRLARSRSDRS